MTHDDTKEGKIWEVYSLTCSVRLFGLLRIVDLYLNGTKVLTEFSMERLSKYSFQYFYGDRMTSERISGLFYGESIPVPRIEVPINARLILYILRLFAWMRGKHV
jgi:hypothetical protein